ncbi:LemA family protein [Paenibacillus sp. strain BS8-2]
MVWAIIIVVLMALYIIAKYNSLLGMRNRIKETQGAIEIYMQQRYDALLKVAQTVVEYAKYEENTLKDIVRQRAGLGGSGESLQALSELNGKLGSIVALAEDYPVLRAGDNYLHLQHTAADLEEKLSAGRRTYNANVVAFNTAIASFPANLISGLFGFKEQQLLEVEKAKKADVSMKEMLQR